MASQTALQWQAKNSHSVSGFSVRWPRILMVLLAACSAMTAFSPVVGDPTTRGPPGPVPAARRRGRRPVGPAADAKMLTAKMNHFMREANSASRLLDLLDGVVEGPVFNKFHASAAYHQLATWKRKRRLLPRERTSPVLRKLNGRVRNMIFRKKLGAREASNVLWATAHLEGAIVNISQQLVPPLLKTLPEQMGDMKPQELSNCFWAAAQLQEAEPRVLQLVPGLAAQVPGQAEGMIPQHLSNCLWAAAQIQEDEPAVLKIVPPIVEQILLKAPDMTTQHLSNCLWAAAQLKEVEPAVLKIVPALAEEIINQADEMIPQGLSSTLLAAARLRNVEPAVLEAVPAIVEQLPMLADRMVPQVLSNSLSALILLQDALPELVQPVLLAPDGRRGFLIMAANLLQDMVPSMTSAGDLHIALPTVVWACAKLGVQHPLLPAVATKLGSNTKLQGMPDWSLCALAWSYQALDPDDFTDFEELLLTEINKRKISDEQVERSQLGSWDWFPPNEAKDSAEPEP